MLDKDKLLNMSSSKNKDIITIIIIIIIIIIINRRYFKIRPFSKGVTKRNTS